MERDAALADLEAFGRGLCGGFAQAGQGRGARAWGLAWSSGLGGAALNGAGVAEVEAHPVGGVQRRLAGGHGRGMRGRSVVLGLPVEDVVVAAVAQVQEDADED